MNRDRRRRLATRLGLAGAALGIVAGLVQVVAGYGIPEWTGAKRATIPLGLLTVGLSVLAGLAAHRQRRDLAVLGRAGCALGLVGPGLLCLTTVGRIWYPAAVLLVLAGGLVVDSWRDTALALAENWSRVLLSLVGGCELLVAAGASPVLMIIGGVGGALVIAAAWLRTAPTFLIIALVAAGTLPLALLGWTALVPLWVAVLAGGLTVLVVRGARRA